MGTVSSTACVLTALSAIRAYGRTGLAIGRITLTASAVLLDASVGDLAEGVGSAYGALGLSAVRSVTGNVLARRVAGSRACLRGAAACRLAPHRIAPELAAFLCFLANGERLALGTIGLGTIDSTRAVDTRTIARR